MKNFLLFATLFLVTSLGINAQDWQTVLKQSDGLPGTEEAYLGDAYYLYTSPLLSPGTSTDRIRMTVTGSINNEAPNGNNIIFALSELRIYDKNGNVIPYTASSNADHNSLSGSEDGDGLFALSDNDYQTYFHSMWSFYNAVTDYHYIELKLSQNIDAFVIEWATRLGEPKNAPTTVGITLGTDYTPSSIGDEFELGDAVTTVDEIDVSKQLFVLKSNAVSTFTNADGKTYNGSGPLYMRYAEEGDSEASVANVMQLIPVDDEHYIIYWPSSGLYLANSASKYNGLNGWQYSTTFLSKAAHVNITSTASGKFEFKYNGANSAGDLTLYVGADMRDNVESKMKTFDLEHKTALENGDYTQGYSLPIAFEWDIYKARLDDSTVESLMLSLSKQAQSTLQPVINDANTYLTEYGNFGGDCTDGEDTNLQSAIASVENTINTVKSFSEIEEAQSALLMSLSRYMAVGLKKYERRVAELQSTATYSSYPYQEGTYPESSKSIIEGVSSTIKVAKEAAGIYTATQYESVFAQIEEDIARFESTKIKEPTGSGGNEGEEDNDEEKEDEDIVYVYLTAGGIDAYSIASLDGNYYVEEGKLCFPIKDGDIMSYEQEEYDSCSKIKPELPFMTSYKFNNKYNPNLNVDAIADTITENMYFSLNAIGKWLTASFQLSDDMAVAYVDSVLQESKTTRQSFAQKVTYKVTYPGYNIIERIKIQDEVWTTPSVNGDTIEIALEPDMLSTNKPSKYSSESLSNLLDGDPSSIFHSTWGSANNATINVNTYIDITLPEALENIQLYYKCRTEVAGYNPLVWEIYVSEDGNTWTLVRTLDHTKDGMPTGGLGQEYTSPTISLGGSYTKLRILQTSGEYSKNHFVLSELRLYKVLEGTHEEPVKIQDAIYENRRMPFGKEYNVTIEWLTDNAISVPRIDIDIDGGEYVTSKDYYLNARFRITGYGVYENFDSPVQIKGRGNSSWAHSKKPYRLKFAEKVKPFGLTKGKSWVLLANAQHGSLMANAISMKIGQMAGAKYTNHIIPVDLYMNGTYMGSYMFTEKVGMANNSVDIDEALGYLLELDTYKSSDEPITIIGEYYLPVKISEPDLADYPTDVAITRRNAIISDVKNMSLAVQNGEIENILDVDALARFYLANDFSLNQEINHPKSTFLFKDESDPQGKITFGPIWDFDWGYGYEKSSAYCYSGATENNINEDMNAHRFWLDLTNIESFKKHYYKAWKEFLDNNSMEELEEYIDSYYNFAKNSFQSNAVIWGSSNGFDKEDRDRVKEWLKTRKEYIYNNLTEYDIDDIISSVKGDVNCNNVLTVHDAALIIAFLNGNTHKTFREGKADVDGNGKIETEDAVATADLVLLNNVPSSSYWHNTSAAVGELNANEFDIEIGDETTIALNLTSYKEEGYNAIQFDLTVPDGIDVYDITAGESLDGHTFMYSQINMNTFRVVAYCNDNTSFSTDNNIVANFRIAAGSVIDETERKLCISNVYAVNNGNNEVRMNNLDILFTETTGIGNVHATISISGGKQITITALESQEIAVHSIDGRLVNRLHVPEGTTKIAVPAGMYIVNGEKVLVY